MGQFYSYLASKAQFAQAILPKSDFTMKRFQSSETSQQNPCAKSLSEFAQQNRTGKSLRRITPKNWQRELAFAGFHLFHLGPHKFEP